MLSNAVGEQSLFNITSDGINFNSITDELIAQLNKEYNEEEFLSGTQIPAQLSLDEAHWQPNDTYSMPAVSTEKQELDCSAFSGIIGQVDLSIAYVFLKNSYYLILLKCTQ